MNKKRRFFKLFIDKVLSKDLFKQILIPLVFLIIAFVLSFVLLSCCGGEWQAYCADRGISKFAFPLYLLIDGNAFNNLYMNSHLGGWTIFASCIIYVVGVIIFSGMVISILTNIITQRVDNYKKGLTHYLKSGHYVILGYDEIVPSVLSDIFSKDSKANVLLMTSANIESIKEKLRKTLTNWQFDRVIINYGHRTSSDYYNDIHLESAEEIFIVGLRSLPAHDAINIECVDKICTYLKSAKTSEKPKRITCVFEDLDTYASFKTTEIFNEVRTLGIEFVPYNFYCGWAKQVFVAQGYTRKDDSGTFVAYPPVYGKGIGYSDDKHVHLVFAGASTFAISFAMEAAHYLHFPNFPQKSNQKTRITFIDLKADEELLLFKTRYRHFFELQPVLYWDSASDIVESVSSDIASGFLDVEFEFIKGNVFSENVQNLLCDWARDKQQYLSVFLAMADQRSNFAMGMNMPEDIYTNEIPIFIRQDRSDNFVTNLRNADTAQMWTYSIVDDKGISQKSRFGRYAHIYPFGMTDSGFCSDDQSLKRAKLINYLYSTIDSDTYQFVAQDILDSMTTNDILEKAEEKWRELTVALKWSNLYCAYSIPAKMASLRAIRGLKNEDTSHDLDLLTEEEIDLMAIVEHNRWNVEKLLMGYRKANPSEDKYAHQKYADHLSMNKHLFIHHDIRPYPELDSIKQLDKDISKYLPWLLKMTF